MELVYKGKKVGAPIYKKPSGSSGITLGQLYEGSIIRLNEGGVPVDFYVAKHDYEPELNGNGRDLVVRRECYGELAWNTTNRNEYATSSIDTWLNGTYKLLLDPAVQECVGTTKFQYTIGNGDKSLSILERSIFMLSITELGYQFSNHNNVEGSQLPNSRILSMATYNNTSAIQYTRTPYIDNKTNVCYMSEYGSDGYNVCTAVRHIRPCFTLPSDLVVYY